VPIKELGITLPHEHIICDASLCKSNRDRVEGLKWGSYMWFDDADVMVEELRAFKADGGGTIVDVTCHGWGRDPVLLSEISRRSGVHIIATAGFYVEDCMPSWVSNRTIEQLTDWIVHELEEGCNSRMSLETTDIRAGMIKTSVSRPNFSHVELRGLKAVANAHLKTGAPITSHNSGSMRFEIEGGNVGMELLDLMEQEGVNPDAVIVGHTDENPDIRNLVSLVRRGAWVQFDTIGKQNYILDDTRADLVVEMKKRGCLDRLLLSQDRNRKPMLRRYHGPGYSDILNRFIPLLRDRGIKSREIDILLKENPAKAVRIRDYT
jgi:phosphotriesterase-related protein